MTLVEISICVGLTITVGGAIFSIYDRFTKPSISQQTEISLLKRDNLSMIEKMQGMLESIKFIKENHLFHIENDIKRIENNQTKILTIIEERYQIKEDKL